MPNRILRAGFADSERVDALKSPVTAESLYVRLMLMVDDFGRGDGRPQVIAAKTYPLRPPKPEKVQSLLDEMQSVGLLTRYVVDGKAYLLLSDFRQRTYSEKSHYPDPPPGTPVNPRGLRTQFGGVVIGEGEGEGEGGKAGALSPARVVDLWNETVNGVLPHVRALTPGREKHIKARLVSDAERQKPEWWVALFKRVAESAFCLGENKHKWRADIDFVIRSEDQIARILEGKYDGAGAVGGSVRAAPQRRPDGIRELR